MTRLPTLLATWTAALALCAPRVGAPPAAPPTSAPRVPVVVAHGEAVVRRAPDRARVQFAVETRAPGPKAASEKNAQIMDAVQARLRSIDLPPDAIQTRGYELHEDVDYPNGKRVSRGFIARNTIEVRVDAIARAGEIIDAAIGAGANNVSSIQFELKDRESVEREALKQAVGNARERAAAAASGAGMSIARVVRIEEGLDSRPPIPLMRMAAQSEMAQADTPIAPGDLEIRATVSLTAELR
jgi:uncharacterized protein YggE